METIEIECDVCYEQGYVHTYNTLNNKDEIQKCDCCNVFESDKKANEHYINYIICFNFWSNNS